MNALVKMLNSTIDGGIRILKFIRMGKDDVQTAKEVAPFGIDGAPLKDTLALYAETMEPGSPVVLGYVNEDQLAAAGELRMYSLKENGDIAFYTWQKADGTMEIGGTADNMVRYSKLEKAFNDLKADFNALVTAYNAHTHPYIDSGSGSTTSPSTSQGQSSTADISGAKINEIKTL